MIHIVILLQEYEYCAHLIFFSLQTHMHDVKVALQKDFPCRNM